MENPLETDPGQHGGSLSKENDRVTLRRNFQLFPSTPTSEYMVFEALDDGDVVEGDIGGKKKEEVMMVELATCKAHGFNERTWLKDVLCRLPEYEQGRKDYDDLLPELSLV